MQATLTIMIPTLVVLIGILLNRQDYARLDAKIDSKINGIDNKIDSKVDGLRADLTAQINELRDDIKEFYRTLGQHDARLDALERQRKA
ncbi:hypothetical protein [Silvibacterium sp.]|uniref:hypothetical protein n=1 Tax=Silvibacterium sp. TaxID=1964179 RepID=UPI0039E58773